MKVKEKTMKMRILLVAVWIIALVPGICLAAPQVCDPDSAGIPLLHSPTEGSMLPGTSATFAWSPNGSGAYYYWVYIGNWPGGNDLADSGLITGSSSITIGGLPADGDNIYVWLWSWINGTWQQTHATYKAHVARLDLDAPAANLAASADEVQAFFVEVPPNAQNLQFEIEGPNGDADLFVRHDSMPNFNEYDCASNNGESFETCSFASSSPGVWYVWIHAVEGFSDLVATVQYDQPSGAGEDGGSDGYGLSLCEADRQALRDAAFGRWNEAQAAHADAYAAAQGILNVMNTTIQNLWNGINGRINEACGAINNWNDVYWGMKHAGNTDAEIQAQWEALNGICNAARTELSNWDSIKYGIQNEHEAHANAIMQAADYALELAGAQFRADLQGIEESPACEANDTTGGNTPTGCEETTIVRITSGNTFPSSAFASCSNRETGAKGSRDVSAGASSSQCMSALELAFNDAGVPTCGAAPFSFEGPGFKIPSRGYYNFTLPCAYHLELDG